MPAVDAIARALAIELRTHRSAVAQEAKLHAAVAAALKSLGYWFEAEHRLSPKDRLDFVMDGGVAIEVKKGTAGLAELDQIGRYLDHEKITGCIVIAMRCTGLPATFRGKPIATIELWRMLL